MPQAKPHRQRSVSPRRLQRGWTSDPGAVNSFLSSGNSFVEFAGHREYQLVERLYQATRGVIENNTSLLVEQAMDRRLEQEQLAVGWEEQ